MDKNMVIEYGRDIHYRPVETVVALKAGTVVGIGFAYFNPKDGVPVKEIGKELATSRAITMTKLPATVLFFNSPFKSWGFSFSADGVCRNLMCGLELTDSPSAGYMSEYFKKLGFPKIARKIEVWAAQERGD